MASDPDQPQVPDGEESFHALVQRQIDGPLRESIARTDLAPRHYLEQAVAKESEIREEVAAKQDAVADLDARVLARDHGRIARIAVLVSVSALFVLTTLNAFSGPSTWLEVAAPIALVVVAGALIVTVVQQLRQSRSGTGSTPTTSAAPSGLTLDEQLAAAKDDLRTALEREVVVWLSLRANEELGEIYDLTLPKLDPTGLAEVDDGEREIATENVADLETTIDLMPGGSIGVSGPRGAGKTTLLNQITEDAGRKRPEEIEVGMLVEAPVEYDAREFVLHLFARLCEDTLGPLRVETMRGWRHGLGRRGALPRPFALLRVPYPPLLGPLVLAVGVIAYLSLEAAAGSSPDPEQFIPLAAMAMILGGVLTAVTLALAIMSRVLGGVLGFPQGSRRPILEAAERHLRQIWFQQTFTSGWSGALKLPLGLEGGTEKTSQLAENQLSYPDVVALYKNFARSLSKRGQVRIGIDELDKMEDERARRFLNEVKVIFRVSGCFYLVSVSEDAMAYFERRGLPFRDVFDSSFDDVMRVGYLSYKDSWRMLRRRVVGMPIPFIALCHALGGGLARDVIRAARDVCEESPAEEEDDQDEPGNRGEAEAVEGPEAPKALGEVTASLCTDELQQKCAAARVTARRLQDPAKVTLLSRWLSEVDAAATSIPALRSQCGEFRQNVVIPLGPSPKSSETALLEHREALSIALEIAAFAYFTITLRDVMGSIVDQAGVERALDEEVVDGLARARQAFTVNPSEAWLAISAARIGPLKDECIEIPDLSDPQAGGENGGDKEEMAAIGQTAGP